MVIISLYMTDLIQSRNSKKEANIKKTVKENWALLIYETVN